MNIIALIVAMVAGITMAVQGAMNSAFAKILGLLEATFIVHLTAAFFVGVLIFLFKFGDGNLGNYAQAPWYLWLGGLLGVVITYGVVASIPKVGVAPATTAIIVGQVTTAMLADHFGVFGLKKIPLTYLKFIGVALLALGARLMLYQP